MGPQPLFRVTLHHRQGQLAVAKAGTGEAVTELRREAAALAVLAHPGVTRILGVDQGPDWMVLWTRHAGVHTLRSAPPCPLSVALWRAGQVMATVAYLHGRGLAHRRLRPEHVVVGPTGEAVLCGLRRAGPADGTAQATDTSTAAALVAATITKATSGPGPMGSDPRGILGRLQGPRHGSVETCLAALREPGAAARDLALLLAEATSRAAGVGSGARLRSDGGPPHSPATDPAG